MNNENLIPFRTSDTDKFEQSGPLFSSWMGVDGCPRIVVKHQRSAKRINKLLKYYGPDVHFIKGEEILFKVSPEMFHEVVTLIRGRPE